MVLRSNIMVLLRDSLVLWAVHAAGDVAKASTANVRNRFRYDGRSARQGPQEGSFEKGLFARRRGSLPFSHSLWWVLSTSAWMTAHMTGEGRSSSGSGM